MAEQRGHTGNSSPRETRANFIRDDLVRANLFLINAMQLSGKQGCEGLARAIKAVSGDIERLQIHANEALTEDTAMSEQTIDDATDPRFTPSLLFDISGLLQKHGYVQTSDSAAHARFLDTLLQLVRHFEGREVQP